MIETFYWINKFITSDEPAKQEEPHETEEDFSGFFPSSIAILQERARNLIHDLNRHANNA